VQNRPEQHGVGRHPGGQIPRDFCAKNISAPHSIYKDDHPLGQCPPRPPPPWRQLTPQRGAAHNEEAFDDRALKTSDRIARALLVAYMARCDDCPAHRQDPGGGRPNLASCESVRPANSAASNLDDTRVRLPPHRPAAACAKGLEAASRLMVGGLTLSSLAISACVSPAAMRCNASWR
jgi:hypothetical protein